VAKKAKDGERAIGYALENYETAQQNGMIQLFITQGAVSGLHSGPVGALVAFGSTTSTSVPSGSFMDTFLHNLFARITNWLGDSANGRENLREGDRCEKHLR
jgi:hypothetical protein